jgi:hypothetical protein
MKGQDDPHIKSIISHITANRDTFFPAEFTFEHSGRQKEVRELFGPLPGKLEDRMEDIVVFIKHHSFMNVHATHLICARLLSNGPSIDTCQPVETVGHGKDTLLAGSMGEGPRVGELDCQGRRRGAAAATCPKEVPARGRGVERTNQ